MNFAVKEYSPSQHLSEYIECYWHGVFNLQSKKDTAFKMIPNGCLELIIHLDDIHCRFPGKEERISTPDYMIIGLTSNTNHVYFDNKVPVFTIRFKPESFFLFFDVKGSEIVERFEDISLILKKEFLEYFHRIREMRSIQEMIKLSNIFLTKRLEKIKKVDSYVYDAISLIRTTHEIDVGSLSEQVNISTRQLERKFKEIIGLSPKKYLQLTRINKVMKAFAVNSKLDLTSIAYYCGYYDQSHFIRDFKKLTGLKPKLFKQNDHKFISLPGNIDLEY